VVPYLCFIKQTENMTFSNLPFGTTVLYNDSFNVDFRLMVIGQTSDQFGTWTEILTETGNIENFSGRTEVDGKRYTIA
jgi:hypothetical protein